MFPAESLFADLTDLNLETRWTYAVIKENPRMLYICQF